MNLTLQQKTLRMSPVHLLCVYFVVFHQFQTNRKGEQRLSVLAIPFHSVEFNVFALQRYSLTSNTISKCFSAAENQTYLRHRLIFAYTSTICR
ncbi:hypothetical protein TNCV_808491 [Trichonephila clavipes]|nr:hypothetical protein TNCV_808491 [Trichonephila clavipes]